MSVEAVSDRLDGWGEITAFLGVSDARTVGRRGYPVHRHVTGRVYALRSELLAHDGMQGDAGNAGASRGTPLARAGRGLVSFGA